MTARPPSMNKIPNPPTEGGSHPTPASMQGQGGATAELEALRERVAKLEGEQGATSPAPPRMVPLGAGFTDQFGRPVMVPAQHESFGERLVRNEFADIDRDE